MRFVSGGLGALLLLFAVTQYNDPDGVFWAAVYGATAALAALAAWRPMLFRRGWMQAVLGLALLAAIGGTAHFWPTEAAWWRVSVWWHAETAREGMGFMMIVATLVVTATTALQGSRHD